MADLDTDDGSFHPSNAGGVFHHGFEPDELRALMQQSGFDTALTFHGGDGD